MEPEKTRWIVRPWMIFAAAMLIIFFRMPARLIEGFVWAEDGPMLIQQVSDLGRRSLFGISQGYAVLLPKLIAYLWLKIVPLQSIPWAFAWSSAVVWALSLTYTFSALRDALKARSAQIVAAAISLFPLLTPTAGEIFLNLTNLQWVLFPCLVAACWTAFSEPEPLHKAWTGILLFGLTSTGPFGALMAPMVMALIAFNWRSTLTRRRLPLVVSYLLPAAFQVRAMLIAVKVPTPEGSFPWLHEFAQHVVADQVLSRTITSALNDSSWIGIVLFGLVVGASMASKSRWIGLSLIAFGALTWSLAAARLGPYGVYMTYDGAGARYLYAPCLALFAAAVLAAYTSSYTAVRSIASAAAFMMTLAGMTTFAIPREALHWSYESDDTSQSITMPPIMPPSAGPWRATIPRAPDAP